MSRHPAILSLPQSLWQWAGEPPAWKMQFDHWAVEKLSEAVVFPEHFALEPDALGLIPYRPDLLAEIGPTVLSHPTLRKLVFGHPRCALALLLSFYAELADLLEPYLEGSGECVFHLLRWAEKTQCRLRRPEGFYRQILIRDSYWGFLHAKRTTNASLVQELACWCADSRHEYAAGAAYFLLQHPAEPVAPYRSVLLGDPFYAYLALPRLSLRGFSVAPEDIGCVPKWACHFAWSDFSTRDEEFIPQVQSDPAWLIELASELGWLSNPLRLRELGGLITNAGNGHPLQRAALQWLIDMKKGKVVGQVATF
jgi:hypothetical protein